MQYSVELRNNQSNQIATTVGPRALLEIRTGPLPPNTAATDTGSLLAMVRVDEIWLSASVDGMVAKVGTWAAVGQGKGRAGHFRLWGDGRAVCHMQGTITGRGGSGDMKLSDTYIEVGKPVTVEEFAITRGNA